MLRVYSREWDGGEVLPRLDPEEIHHLVRVRRVRPGEPVELLNGRGKVGHAKVVRAGGRSLEMALERVSSIEQPALRLRLLVALPKGKTFPTLLHKAVELGVSRITPLVTEHVEALPERAGKKQERWESVLIEAVKQSGNPWMPLLDPPTGLPAVLPVADSGHVQRVCAALQPDTRPLWQLLGDPLQPRGVLEVFVGPEGDFSGAEYDQLRQVGCHFVSLGPLVLKVETAASLLVGTLQLWAH